MFARNRIPIFIGLIVLILMACAVSSAPVVPTRVPGAAETFVAQTVSAFQTEQAILNPSATFTAIPPSATSTQEPPTATWTPSPLPILPTLVEILPTSTITPTATTTVSASRGDYDCKVESYSPDLDSVISTRKDIDIKWVVRNVGKETWYPGIATYRYVSGSQIQKLDSYELTSIVPPGQTITLVIDAITPKNPTLVDATWAIASNGVVFCKGDNGLRIRLDVQ